MNIPINPVLRDDFDVTPNDERPTDEIEQWWGVFPTLEAAIACAESQTMHIGGD